MNLASAIILAVVLAAAAFALTSVLKSRRRPDGCEKEGTCSGCSLSDICKSVKK